VGCSLHLSETEGCQERPCTGDDAVVDCEWEDWSAWSDCSVKCGGGQRTRDRRIARDPTNGGEPCQAQHLEEIEPCNPELCQQRDECVDGAWGSWSDWETCSQTCNGGHTWRQRQLDQEANQCGRPAEGLSRETAACGSHTPCKANSDCRFGAWEDWSECTRSCGGAQKRWRRVDAGRGSGSGCSGPVREEQSCDIQGNECEGDTFRKGECGLDEWGPWEACSVTCGGAQTERRRSFPQDVLHRSVGCEATLAETKPCGRQSCDEDCTAIDCHWSDWGTWSACDKCGGQRKRYRHVRHHPSCGGVSCDPGASEEITNCTRSCHGGHYCLWEDWSTWGACTASCGAALRQRKRQLAPSEAPPPACSHQTHLRVLLEVSGDDGDGLQLQQKLKGLHKRATVLEERRNTELVLSFMVGFTGLLAALAAGRFRPARALSLWLPSS